MICSKCSKYLARFWWEYQWKTMQFQVNDAFLIAETLQVMALQLQTLSTSHRPYLLCNLPFPFSCSARNSYISLTNACLGLFYVFIFYEFSIVARGQEKPYCSRICAFAFPIFLKCIVTSNLAQAHMGFRHENVCVLHDVYPGQKKSLKAMNRWMLYTSQNESLESRGSVQWPRFWSYHQSHLNFCGISHVQVEPAKSPTRVNILQQLNP